MFTMWTVPLFLFASKNHSDTTLLPKPPSVQYGNDYELVDSKPVAYAHEYDPLAKYPLITLRSFWSEERQDLQTSTWTLEELNAHGGNYTLVEEIGLLSATVAAGQDASSFVPLTTSYDESRKDALAAPLSYEDINLLSSLSSSLGSSVSFSKGHRIGFGRQADCDYCSVSVSEAFPSAGGADCYYECSSGLSCHGNKYNLGLIESAEAYRFDANMKRAGEILKEFGDIDTESGSQLHMTLNYFCCYSDEDWTTMASVLNGISWPALNVTFDQPLWRIDSGALDADHYSLIVMLDQHSQEIMSNFVLEVESKIRQAGVDIHVPRADQEPFHSTLAVASGSSYPCMAALQEVNKQIPPGSWTSSGPITLDTPEWGV